MKQKEADAKLIAAAPDMLAALEAAFERLKECEVAIDGEWGICRSYEELEKDDAIDDSIKKVKAAIDKATK